MSQHRGANRSPFAAFRKRAEFASAENRQKLTRGAQIQLGALRDDLRFGFQWAVKPRSVGAIAPSGRQLARAMAAQVDPALPGSVVELGPGTGVITRALIERGIAEERLILIEFNRDFAVLLRKRFPKARVLEGDAFALARTVRALGEAPLGVVYATDATAAPDVTVIGTFPADSHAPITYPVARLAAAEGEGASDFLSFLAGPEARAAFEAQGFTVLEP